MLTQEERDALKFLAEPPVSWTIDQQKFLQKLVNRGEREELKLLRGDLTHGHN